MADPGPITVTIDFRMADPEGAAPLRVVAGHATRVGEAWTAVGARMMELADSLERLTQPDGVTVHAADPHTGHDHE